MTAKAHVAYFFRGKFGEEWLFKGATAQAFRGRHEGEKAHVFAKWHMYLIRNAAHVSEFSTNRPALVGDIDGNSAIDSSTLGDISRLYADLSPEARSDIAKRYASMQPKELGDWLRGLTHLRNVAAHHARLWNIRSYQTPAMPPGVRDKIGKDSEEQSIGNVKAIPDWRQRYYAWAIVIFFLLQQSARHTTWHHRMDELLKDKRIAPDDSMISTQMGFPASWHERGYWTLG